jgi:predicted ABC-type exoprotein transport system permease subunit
MRGVLRFLSWFLLVPYFSVQLIPTRPWFPGVSQEYHNRLKGQSIVAIIILLLGMPLLFPLFPAVQSRTSEYSIAIIVTLPAWAITGLWLRSLKQREYRTEFNFMPTWKRCAFGFCTLAVVITTIAVEPVGRHLAGSKETHLRCNDAATEMTADECSAQ